MTNQQPNIVFILADDYGWNDLSVEGSTFYETPCIDRIANEGMRFTQGYATCQVCSPSRASIMTGKYTPRHGITDYIGGAFGPDWRRHGRFSKLLPPEYDRRLRADEITFPDVLREAGYRTFFAGKWHLGDEGSYPEDHGFDINIGGWQAGGPRSYFTPYQNPRLPDGPAGECLPLRLAGETAKFIEGQSAQPFLAYLSFYSVHAPIQTSRDRWEKFRRKAVSDGPPPATRFAFDRYLPVRQVQDCPVYAGMIEAMDDAVGVVLEALERTGQADNTIVVFTSDNGGVSSGDAYATSCLPLRGGKGRQWEGGIREPFYVRAPGVTTPGRTCDVPVSGIDFYPTLLELAGQSVPEAQQVDGVSLTRLLQGREDERLAERDLFWHYPHYGNQGGEPSSIIRRQNWKLIHYYEDGRDELYDLAADPGEQTDLAGTETDRTQTLRKDLDTWLNEVDARPPVPDPEYDAAKEQARLADLAGAFMAKLETEHAGYLDPDWEPDPAWWGSMVTVD